MQDQQTSSPTVDSQAAKPGPVKPVYWLLAQAVQARKACLARGPLDDFAAKWDALLDHLERENLPSGSGFDSGTEVDREASTADCLILRTSYHHMGESGMYDGWTEHKIAVRPSLIHGFTVTIGGRDLDGFKDYAADVFQSALADEIAWPVVA